MSPAAALTDRKSSTRQKIYKIVASGILPQVWLNREMTAAMRLVFSLQTLFGNSSGENVGDLCGL